MNYTPMTTVILIMVIAMATVLVAALVVLVQNHASFRWLRAWWNAARAEVAWRNTFADELVALCENSQIELRPWESESIAHLAFTEQCEGECQQNWQSPRLTAYHYWQRRFCNGPQGNAAAR